MGISSSYLDAFFKVTQVGSFTSAAMELGLTQSALSQRILNLEQDLRVTLLLRDKSGLRLTPEGEALFRYCRTREQLEREVLDQFAYKDESYTRFRGTLKIAGFTSIMRSRVLPKLQDLLLENDLSLTIINAELGELEGLLKSGEVDFIITDKEHPSESVVSLRAGIEKNVLCESNSLRHISDWYLDNDINDHTTRSYFEKYGGVPKIFKQRFLDDVYGLIDGVKLGVGRALLPLHLVDQDPEIKIINKRKTYDIELWLQYYRQPYYSRGHEFIVNALSLL